MKLLVGLGNPGARYATTRHNVGWMAVDAIARRNGFGPERAKFQGALAEGRLGGERALILKPETFMNLSGQSVGAALRFLKIEAADVVVFHDELDLPQGRLRVKQGGGHAGHNGLRSMIQHVGEGFMRVRIGIGRPEDKAQVANYVLHPFDKADAAWLEPLLDAIADAAPLLAGGDAPAFQNRVAHLTAPPKPDPEREPAPVPPRAPAADPHPAPESTTSPLDSLAARFRRD